MRLRFILSSIVSIVALVGICSGQQSDSLTGQGRLLIGTEGGIWRGAGGYTLLPSQTVGTIEFPAGKTLRVRFAESTISGRVTSIAVDESDPSGKTYFQLPCEGGSTALREGTGSGSSSTGSNALLASFFAFPTVTAWKGSCRLLVVKLVDGSYRRVKVKFQ